MSANAIPRSLAGVLNPSQPAAARSFIKFCKERKVMTRGLVKIGLCPPREPVPFGASGGPSAAASAVKSSTGGGGSRIRGLMALKPIPKDENIVMCPVQSAFSLATVLRDDEFVRDAFGFTLREASTTSSSSSSNGRGRGRRGSVYAAGVSGGRSIFRSLLVPDQVLENTIPQSQQHELWASIAEHVHNAGGGSSSSSSSTDLAVAATAAAAALSFSTMCPVKSRVGSSSIVRHSQLLMALYMSTMVLESAAQAAVTSRIRDVLFQFVKDQTSSTSADPNAKALLRDANAREQLVKDMDALVHRLCSELFAESSMGEAVATAALNAAATAAGSAAGASGSSTASFLSLLPSGGFVDHFRFLPSPFGGSQQSLLSSMNSDGTSAAGGTPGHIDELMGDFTDFSNMMNQGVLANTQAGRECVDFLCERFAAVRVQERVSAGLAMLCQVATSPSSSSSSDLADLWKYLSEASSSSSTSSGASSALAHFFYQTRLSTDAMTTSLETIHRRCMNEKGCPPPFSLDCDSSASANSSSGASMWDRPLLHSEAEARSALTWALAMVYSRGTVLEHAATIQQAFYGLRFPSSSSSSNIENDHTSRRYGLEKLFEPLYSEMDLLVQQHGEASVAALVPSSQASSAAANTKRFVHRDVLFPVVCPIIDLVNHTKDPKKENAAIFVPELEESSSSSSSSLSSSSSGGSNSIVPSSMSRVICLRSLRPIRPGEEICMTYAAGERELDIFYGMRDRYRLQ